MRRRQSKGATIAKYLVLYRLSLDAPDPMKNPDPVAMEAGKAAWGAWLQSIGPALVDFGSPTRPVDAPVIDGSRVSGFTILQAASDAEVADLLASHPHNQTGTFEVHAFVGPPGT